jgi:heat shock protein HslJ
MCKKTQRLWMLILLLVILAGCTQSDESDLPGAGIETNLAGTEWRLVSLNGDDLNTDTAITLIIEDEYLGGEMSCNGYGGSMDGGKYIASSDGSFKLELPLAVTMQYCEEPEGIMEQENAYIAALMNAAYFQVVDDRLEFEDEAGEVILIYQKK